MEQEKRIQLREEKREKRKRRRKRAIKIIVFLLFLITLIILSLTVFFKVKKVTLDGTSVYSETDIIAAAGIDEGENLFRLNREQIKRNIESKYPDIGNIQVSIKLPNEVIIKDTGYSELFALKDESGYIIIDKSKNIRRMAKSRPSKMILIENIIFEQPKLYSVISFKNDKQFESVLALASAFRENGISKINSISVESLDTIQAVYDGRVTLVIGSLSGLTEKLQKAKYILELDENKNAKGTLDLTVDNTAYFK